MAITKITPLPGPVDKAALGAELAAIPLPGLTTVAVLRRETDANGDLVLDANGKAIPVARYVMITSDPLSAAQIAAAEAVVAAHVPAPEPTPQELDRTRAENTMKSNPFVRSLIGRELAIRRAAGEPALTVQDIIDELKAALP